MDTLAPGEQVEIVATDAGFARDASAWCDTTGNRLIGSHEEKGRYTVTIEKGDPAAVCPSSAGAIAGRGKTLILFSDDLDKALATFVLAMVLWQQDRRLRSFHFLGIECSEESAEAES